MSITADEFDDYGSAHDEGGLSGFYVLAIFLALIAAFLVIIYFAYEKGKATAMMDDADLPVVAADPRPIREEVPLAMNTDERSEVYDRIEGVTPTRVIADTKPSRDPLEGYASAPGATSPVKVSETKPATSTPDVAPLPKATAPIATPKPEPKPAVVAAATPAKPAAATPAPAKPTAPVAGTHVVQVGAFGSDEEAMRFYNTLSSKHGGFVSSKSADIQVAEVKGTTYHRLRLAPFTSKAAANDYCAGLKAKGQDCLVRGV